jgi:adenine-specific DNA-methyltransferase
MPRKKTFLSEVQNGLRPNTILFQEEVGNNQEAKQEVKALFNGIGIFDGPKPVRLIKTLILIANTKRGDICLDFFSGSAATAHAVMQLNAEDGGNRKFILVQLPEACAEGSEAAKAGYKNICEIGKERIRRAGEKIVDELAAKNAKESAPNLFRYDLQDSHDLRGGDNSVNPVNPVQRQSKLDVGFRVFKVDSSSMDDIYFQPLEVQQQDMIRMINNVKTDRTALDLLFGCLLEWGLPVDLPITKRTDLGNDTYDVDGGRIIASFDSNVGDAAVKAIANEKPDFAIFRDLSFNNSAAKINVGEIFKAISPNTQVKVL